MGYKVIFFDVDNTLLDFDKTELYALEKTVEEVGYPYSKAVYKVYDEINNKLWDALEVGKMDVATLKVKRFEQLVEALKIDYSGKDMSKLYEKHLGEKAFEIEDAYKVCSTLSKKYRLALVTNGITQVQKHRIEKSSFKSFIERLFISEEVGISKPDAGIFEYAMKEMGIEDKREVLMVGDSPSSDIKGSMNAGIDSCFFNPKEVSIEQSIKPTYEIKKLSELIQLL